jgi:hypothetical protein
MRTAYVQQNDLGEWLTPSQFAAQRGFALKGYEVRPYTYEQLLNGECEHNRHIIYHGGVQAVVEALKRIGVQRPDNFDLPEQLREDRYLRRKWWTTTLQEARSLEKPIFIKPLEGHKRFTGHVVRCFSDLLKTSSLPSEYPVLAQEPITFLSEFRYFVVRGRAVGMSCYWGRPLILPDGDRIQEMIQTYTNCPVAYSLDVGTIEYDTGNNIVTETALVEVNDFFSLGSYGLDALLYVEGVELRWDEMVRQGKAL